ncbi:MAG: DUF4340 domain-containing protein [Bacteroidales bacterium]
MNKTLFFASGVLLILFLLGLLVYFPWLNSTSQFSFSDANSIRSIIISNTLGKEILVFEKCKHEWCLKENNEEVQKDRISEALFALQQLEIKYPLMKELQASYEKAIKNGGIKVQLNTLWGIKRRYSLYKVDSLVVGVIGNGLPYVVEVSNNEKLDLMQLLDINAQTWRKTLILSLPEKQINSIEIENLAKPQRSFLLKIDSLKNTSITTSYDGTEFNQLDNNKVWRYLSYFRMLDAERYATELSSNDIEAILTSEAAYIITIQEFDGSKHRITLFNIPSDDEFDAFGRATKTDLNRCYLQKDEEGILAIVRWIDIDILVPSPKFFFTKN